MDILPPSPHSVHNAPRATLDRGTLATRLRQVQDHSRSVSAPRVQRQFAKRANHPQHRQPRVRLGKPTGHDTFVHWQDYLDIAELHKAPEAPVAARAVESSHGETISDMVDRYRGVAQQVSDKLDHFLHDVYLPTPAPELVEPDAAED